MGTGFASLLSILGRCSEIMKMRFGYYLDSLHTHTHPRIPSLCLPGNHFTQNNVNETVLRSWGGDWDTGGLTRLNLLLP